MTTIAQIKKECRRLGLSKFSVRRDDKGFLVDVEGTVRFTGEFDFENRFPIRFGYVSGDFNCSFCKLTTLEGAPYKIGGSFHAQYNQLTSLEHFPLVVGGHINLGHNQLTSLVGLPFKDDFVVLNSNPLPYEAYFYLLDLGYNLDDGWTYSFDVEDFTEIKRMWTINKIITEDHQ